MQWTNCVGTYLKKELKKKDGLTNDYTGEFGSIPGKREGKGSSKVYRDGILIYTFNGKFKDDKPNEQGTITWVNGDKLKAVYKDGKKNGQGTFTFSDGKKFVGEFKNGKKNGQGTFTFSDGDKLKAVYKDGELNGQGTITYTNGDKFVGEWKNNELNGQGTITYSNGDKEVALYKDDEIVKIISSTVKKENSTSNTFNSSSTLSGHEHCKNVWRRLINIRDGYSKNSSDYYRLDALVQKVFDLWTGYKGTNAKDPGNCDKILSLGSK